MALFARAVNRIEIETHSYCNRRCDYCPNVSGDRLGENRRMADDVWFLALGNLREIDYAHSLVLNNYNEPLADKMIVERIKQAREYLPRARIMIYSNGDYLNKDYLGELAEAGLDYLHISIHTHGHRKYSDVGALNHIVKLSRRLDLPVKFREMKSSEYIFANIPYPTLEIEVRAIDYWRYGMDRGGLVEGFSKEFIRTDPCHFPFSHFQIGYAGAIVPCCQIRSDSRDHTAYHYGNLKHFGTIFEAFGSPIATGWRRHLISLETKDPPCRTCTAIFFTQAPQDLAHARRAWEHYVRDTPLP